MLRRAFNAVKSSLLWVKALDRVSQSKFDEAFKVLTEIYSVWRVSGPSNAVTPDINILFGLVTCKLGEFDLAIASIKLALSQLDKGKPRYSDYDKDYLRYYCKIVMEYCSASTNFEVFRDSQNIDVSFSSLRFDKVSDDIRRNFPITSPLASERLREASNVP